MRKPLHSCDRGLSRGELPRSCHPTDANSILLPREMQPPVCDTAIFKLPLVLGIRLLSSSLFKIKAFKVIPKLYLWPT